MNFFVSKITSQQELFPFKDPHNPLIPWWVCLFIMGKFAFFFYARVKDKWKLSGKQNFRKMKFELVSHFKYGSVPTSFPDSPTIPSPILPPGDHKVITEY